MPDKFLRQIIVDELDFDPSVNAATIGVAVQNGIVTLSGHVGSYAQKVAAERAVQRVRGVRAIAEEVEVRYPGDKQTSDDQIAERALAIMAWSAQVPNDAILVKVQEGWVTLTGSVHWQFQRMAAESAVRKLTGVVGVSNQIEVTPQAQPADIKLKILNALNRHSEFEVDSIRVNVANDTVTLEGKVNAWYERGLAERAAWSAPGVKAVDDRLSVA